MSKTDKIAVGVLVCALAALFWFFSESSKYEIRCSKAGGAIWIGPGGEKACLVNVRRIDP